MRKGVYFLANDNVLDNTIAMLNSLRLHCSDIDLCCIPFNEDVQGLKKLGKVYGFQILEEGPTSRWDAIGKGLFPNSEFLPKLFRKFQVFDGPLDHFVFIDTDIVVFEPLDDIFCLMEGINDAHLIYADHDPNVYEPGSKLLDQIEQDSVGNSFNTGFWASQRDLISYDQVEQAAQHALEYQSQFCPRTMEQPFFNFCIHHHDIKHFHLSKLDSSVAIHHWAKQTVIKNDGAYLPDTANTPENQGRRLKFLHWAGVGPGHGAPNQDIFLDFRLMNRSFVERHWYTSKLKAQYLWGTLFRFGIRTKLKKLLKQQLS